MKNINLTLTAFLGFTLLVSACTKKFEDYNKDLSGITEAEMSRIPIGGAELYQLINWVIPNQENGYQMDYDLPGVLSGFVGSPNFTSDFARYAPRQGWNDYPFDDTFGGHLYTQYNVLKRKSEGDMTKPYFALGTLLRVAIVHRVADCYGPVPYSKVTGVDLRVPYDTEEELYTAMLADLKTAVEALDETPVGDLSYKDYDEVYGGDMHKWATYGRSLMLRMAIRISGVAPSMAKEYAEYAVQKGVIESNDLTAALPSIDNPAVKMNDWNDSRVGADIVEYMLAFGDPRTSAYFTAVRGEKPFGLHVPPVKGFKGDPKQDEYSRVNVAKDSPIYLITAAEVSFLRAEGKLLGWSVGDKSAREYYEEGIRLSCEQWGVEVGDYLSSVETRGGFQDLVFPDADVPSFSSDITVSWDAAAGDKERELAQIITQKWIALFPYNTIEAWSEWRRTGYPNLLTATINESKDCQDIVRRANGKDYGGMRRFAFSNKEKVNNLENVNAILPSLNGPDTHATDLWWALKK